MNSTAVSSLLSESTNSSISERGLMSDPSNGSSAVLTGTLRQQMEARLVALKCEYEKGQMQLRQLESVRETMLRISGAITVLEELLVPESPVAATRR